MVLFGGTVARETGSKFLPQNGPVADPGEARVRPLFLDQTEARRAEKKIGQIPPPSQHGRMVSASHSKSGGPGFESRSGDLEDLFSVVPSSDHRPRL